jgi:methionyl-tRNA synthetase
VKQNYFCQNWRRRNSETNRQIEATKTANIAENKKKSRTSKDSIWGFCQNGYCVGTILEAEKCRTNVDFESRHWIDVRTIVSGIAESFKPEDIIGKK